MDFRKTKNPIDIVIPWVDDTDPAWRAERDRFAQAGFGEEDARFRDWGTFRYVFRGIERFAPWVRTVHFVTFGHIPDWLDTSHPKLNVVRHGDFIPAEYLPTFNINAIELNLHRIPGLADRFVYFNDDTFLVGPTEPGDFFKRGLPCGAAVLCPRRTTPVAKFYIPMANAAAVSEHFSPRRSIARHPGKWLNPKYGPELLSTLLMLPYPAFYGFREYHLPNAFLKSSFAEVWAAEPEMLRATCANRFRQPIDVNQWLVENWQFASGRFAPRSPRFGKNFDLEKDPEKTLAELAGYVRDGKGKVVCVGDSAAIGDVASLAASVRDVLDGVLPERSSFEREG